MSANSFDLPAFREPDPRGILATLYAVAATPWRDIAQQLAAPFFKYGLTSRADVRDRYLDLSRRRYGALLAPLEDRYRTILDHPLGAEVFGTRLPDPVDNAKTATLMALLPHAEFSGGTVQFRLPRGVDLTGLEQRFQTLLAPRNLNAYLATEDAKARRIRAGYPATTRLFSDYDTQGHGVLRSRGLVRRSLCSELFCIRPKYELAILLTALVQAIREAEENAARIVASGGKR